MKKLAALFGLVIASVAAPSYAATGSYNATVAVVYVPVSSTAPSLLNLNAGSGTVGTCKMPPAANRLFKLPATAQGDKMRQLLLAAELAGKSVVVTWDDTIKDAEGYCIVQSVGVVAS